MESYLKKRCRDKYGDHYAGKEEGGDNQEGNRESPRREFGARRVWLGGVVFSSTVSLKTGPNTGLAPSTGRTKTQYRAGTSTDSKEFPFERGKDGVSRSWDIERERH